jgi:hypothetical protein
MPVLPAHQDADVLDLRAHRALRGIQGHQPAVVPGMPAAVGAVRRLRADPPGPRRNRWRAAVLDVPAPRARLLAQLPWLRAAGQAHRGPVRALRTRQAAARPARRCGRRDPPGTPGPLPGSLADAERPDTAASWLAGSSAAPILRDLGTGRPLTHSLLDALPEGKHVEHLRSVLVSIGTLPPRDEQMNRLERWIATAVTSRGPGEQELLHRYAVWHLLRRLRRRSSGGETTHNQLTAVRRHVRAAIVLLDWLTARGLTLTTCGQGDLDNWMTSPSTTHRREAGHFVRWARAQKLTGPDFPATKWGGPARTIDTEARWDQARRLLHDNDLRPEDRVAGLLVLLYAQGPSAISRLTLDHVQLTDGNVLLRLGREPVVLPEPLAGLTRQLVADRHGHAAIGDQGTSPWLFPGGQPGRPISSSHLNERLRQLGLHPGQDRSTALFQLAADLPAALLARMLGIHITVAVAWQRASSGDWTSYAADVSRRTRT